MTKLTFIILLSLQSHLLFATDPMADVKIWHQYALQSGVIPTYGNELKLYQNGEVQEPLKSLIDNSEKFLLIRLLSFECDHATEPFVQKIERKAKSGTRVYLTVNKMYSYLSMSCLKRLEGSGVQISRQKSHSSYWVNDKKELLLGSQSMARMFLLADGRNGLDRDVMIYAKGPISLEAVLDFTQSWDQSITDIKDWALQNRSYRAESLLRGATSPCYFLSQDALQGYKSWSDTLLFWISQAETRIFISGVKIEKGSLIETKRIHHAIEEARKGGVEIQYLGNGPRSGNGEFSMVLNEWIDQSPLWAPVLTWLRNWDSDRRWRRHQIEYQKLIQTEGMKIHLYDQFLHYKVWTFDEDKILVGSANLADESFEKFHDAALFCKDEKLTQLWKKAQMTDLTHSEPFENRTSTSE